LTLFRPITIGYVPSEITSTQLGYVKEGTYNTPFTITANAVKLVSTLSLDAGVWLVSSFVSSYNMTGGSIFYLVNSINSASTSVAQGTSYGTMAINLPANGVPEMTTSAIISLSAITNIYSTINAGTSGTLQKVKFSAVRLA